MPVQPKSVVYLRPDTIRDLVIFTSALAELQRAWPKARHTVVVRAGYEALAPLFPAGIEWRVARFNPFSAKPADCRAPLATLLTELESLQPDLIVADNNFYKFYWQSLQAIQRIATENGSGEHGVLGFQTLKYNTEIGRAHV